MIDDNIVNLIPYKQSDFTSLTDRNKISFLPFYSAIKGKLQSETFLPGKNNSYTSKNFAYWASDTELSELFSNEQIAELMEKENANWVFTSLGRKTTQNEKEYINYSYVSPKTDYLDSLIFDFLEPEKILRRINEAFISKQSFQWLKNFYKYLLDKRSYWEVLKRKPIFINTENKAVSAYEIETGKNLILFFPTEIETTYQTIHKDFLSHNDSKLFFEAFGIAKPKLKDEIYHNILPQYQNNFDYSDTDKIKQHFVIFLNYFDECLKEKITDHSFINRLKEIEFLACKMLINSAIIFKKPVLCYFPTDDLKLFFESKTNTLYINLEFYDEFIKEEKREVFNKFLEELGVNELPIVHKIDIEISPYNLYKLKLNEKRKHICIYDKYIDGSESIISLITFQKSRLFWKLLCSNIKGLNSWQIKNLIQGSHKYSYHGEKTEQFNSTEYIRLTTSKWIYTKSGSFASPAKISVTDFADGYDISSPEAKSLIEFLGIANPDAQLNLSEEQRRIYELGKIAGENNLTPEDLKRLIESSRKRQSQQNGNTFEDDKENEESAIDKTLKKIKEKFQQPKVDEIETAKSDEETDEKDEDEFTKPSVDFEKKILRKEEQLKAEIEQITRIQELTEAAHKAEKYSFIWFKSLLELEYLNSSEKNSNGKEISIQFTKVEKEIDTNRTLVLKHPDRYIPQSIEDVGNLTVRLFYGTESSSVSAEVVNVKEFTLRAKLNKSVDLSNIDLNSVFKAIIDIKNPVFILDELLKNFTRLPFEDSFNLQKNLTENIEFVFGPPGTGKTTHLANNVLIPLMQKEEDLKILVLTPTNKAADVLVNRITETMKADESYVKWLVRFGLTGNSEIEQSPIFCDKNFDIRTKPKNVTVTTIARFPYDYFQPDGLNHRLHLREMHWDYIVIDEASMIPLVNIIFPLYYNLVEKLFASSPFNSTNVDIQVGTIHGFQGDECDIIISLLNPPSYISESPEMFLNKQNILNVSISRARDYLFILMPDDKTENIYSLQKIQRIVELINEKAKDNSTQFHSSDIEKVMFKNKNFIEQNSFSTTHQSVNVYSEAEMLYEIRCEETAIDIQVSTQKAKGQAHL